MIPEYFFESIGIGNLELPIYPLAYSLGYAVMGIIVLVEVKRRLVDITVIYNTILIGIVGALVGARIDRIITNYDYFATNPSEIWNLASGGWVESGGFILSLVLIIWYLRRKNTSVLGVLDLAAPAFANRFAISRFGCGAVHDHIGKIMDTLGHGGDGVSRHYQT